MVGPKRRKRANQKKSEIVVAASEVLPEPKPQPEPEPEPEHESPPESDLESWLELESSKPEPEPQQSTGLTLDQLPYDIVYMVSQKLLPFRHRLCQFKPETHLQPKLDHL